jgi:hypothetical protein
VAPGVAAGGGAAGVGGDAGWLAARSPFAGRAAVSADGAAPGAEAAVAGVAGGADAGAPWGRGARAALETGAGGLGS